MWDAHRSAMEMEVLHGGLSNSTEYGNLRHRLQFAYFEERKQVKRQLSYAARDAGR